MRNEIVKGLHIEEYHKSDGLSNSGMGYLLDCPYRYYAHYLDPKKPKEKEADHFSLGKVVHTLILEPEKFDESFFVMPKLDKRKTEDKKMFSELSKMATGKNIVEYDIYEKALAMTESAFKRINWLGSILKDACIEESLFFVDDETGVQLKSRPDVYTEQFYIDLKTTKSITRNSYTRSILEYGYDRQAALAKAALFKLHKLDYSYFMHIVIEESYPYLCAAYIMDDEFIEKGKRDYKKAASIYKICITKNEWPDYTSTVQQIYCPEWAK